MLLAHQATPPWPRRGGSAAELLGWGHLAPMDHLTSDQLNNLISVAMGKVSALIKLLAALELTEAGLRAAARAEAAEALSAACAYALSIARAEAEVARAEAETVRAEAVVAYAEFVVAGGFL